MQIRSLIRIQGAGKPRIQRDIWRAAVIRHDDRGEEKAIRTRLLNATVARRMSAKAGRIVEAGNPPDLGMFREVRENASVRILETPERRGNSGARDTDRLIQMPP